ncbi:surface-adhesin E family protein [Psychrobacter sp. AOP30-A2-5]|uniref:surface-adhesin E family protein n=1 Tax=Psychrobacter sp. AOP30-A2-5 TaxID=3457697 RepID=UPI0040375106
MKWPLLAATLLLSFASLAAVTVDNFTDEVDQWVLISDDPNGKVYMLPSTITEDEIGNRLVWLKAVNEKPLKNIKTLKTLYVFDCKFKKIGISHYIELDKNGKVIGGESMSSTEAALYTRDPDSLSYELMQGICK